MIYMAFKSENYFFFRYKILTGISSYDERSEFVQDNSSNWNFSFSAGCSDQWWPEPGLRPAPGPAPAAAPSPHGSTGASTAPGHPQLSCAWNYRGITGKWDISGNTVKYLFHQGIQACVKEKLLLLLNIPEEFLKS